MDKLIEFVQILPNVVALLCPKLKENTQSLKRKIELLESRKKDIDVELSRSEKKCREEVEKWMENVEYIKKEFETLEQVQQSSRFYHVFKRQKLAEQLERMNEEVTELDRRDFSSGLFQEVDERAGPLLLTSQLIGQAQKFDDIWTSLMDDGILSIGIYGMGGVGKTTLAKRVHDKLLKEPTFSGHVYWVTVSSQEFTIYNLQSDIAQVLNLEFTCEDDERKRAAQLFQAFQKKERCVLILDDVWKPIDTCKIGIRCIPSKRDGCKLVITSRSEKVCHGTCCEKFIKVNTLSEQGALDLFLKTLNFDERSSQVTEICKKMVNRCGGLPLALVTLAGSMRGVTDVHEWEDEWDRLKESCMGQVAMESEVLPILLYSYHRLRDTRLKSCFLYCSLYPQDFEILREEFIERFILEELMERRSSWQAEFNQGHSMLNKLLSACLLESVSDGYLKMHDLIREMAIGITKDTPRYMVKAGLHLKELPEEQEWTEDLDKVSLMRNSIEEISPGTSPKCPSLSTLILTGNPLRLIPDCFFTHMRGLRTLDLSYTSIACLPNSISDLEKLKALLFRGCSKLGSVPSLEKLKVLRHLDLAGTIIEEVPQGMKSLTNLKSLSLVCDTLRMIPTGTLHGLTHLQRLELPYHFDVSIEEVETLKQLEVFRCRLNSVHDLNRLINSRQIDKQLFFYDIAISSLEIRRGDSLPCKHLYFGENGLMESSSDTHENMLPRDIERLWFSKSGLSGCLLDEFPTLNYVRDLKKCRIYKEDKIECIMRLEDEQQSSTGVPFQSLEKLKLRKLPNLIGLFKWDAVVPLPPGTFSSLKKLSIVRCDKIKKLVPQSLVLNFHNLQSLQVWYCDQMEELIEDDNNEGADIILPKLKSLHLHRLPQLKSICKGKMICDSIERIELGFIENVKELPLNLLLLHGQLSPPPRLEGIYLDDHEWWESLEWTDHNAKNVLEPLVEISSYIFVGLSIDPSASETDLDAPESGEESDASESGEEESQC